MSKGRNDRFSMSETSTPKPEKNEALDDNARKFTLEDPDSTFLDSNEVSSFVMTTDWLTTDKDSEEKLAHKKFKNGEVQILLIKKVTKDGKRTSVKEKITEEKYEKLKARSILRVEKTRYEFTYSQNDTDFSMKYDEFTNSPLRVLEVDANSDPERESFVPNDFPVLLKEVTGNLDYYGFRVSSLL